MEQSEIENIAKSHIERMNLENPYADKMNWILTKPILTDKGYYFDYNFEVVNSDESLAFGGAPGFLISAQTGSIKDLS
ncbi:MAG: hypothetical protein MK078_10530 [Crocinitomicaceae bacterium]|nr:hypothetical protein [Crocinitomicaceae bacterium]